VAIIERQKYESNIIRIYLLSITWQTEQPVKKFKQSLQALTGASYEEIKPIVGLLVLQTVGRRSCPEDCMDSVSKIRGLKQQSEDISGSNF